MLFEYETDRLILKILHPEHAAGVLDFYNRDLELFEKYEPDRMPNFYTVAQQQKIMRFEYNNALKMSMVRFYVFKKENPLQIIGTVCIHDITRSCYQSCELGYKFSSQFHRQGYAYEAISKVMEICFMELGLHRINATVCIGNDPSACLLEKLGFKHEGILRDYLMLQGQWRDHHMYSILKTDLS